MKTIYRTLLFIVVVSTQHFANAQCAGVSITMNVLSQTNVSCNGGSNGEVIVEGNGGTGPYSFFWSPISVTNDTVTGLSAGMYVVTITDAIGCDSTDTVYVTEPPILDVTAVSTPATCGSADGTATAFPSGGVAPYSYNWSPFGGANQAAVGLVPANYTVTVTDDNGCQAAYVVTVNSVGGPNVILQSLTNVSCNGYSDGMITVTAVGGDAPYTYTWLPGGMTGDTITDLEAGTYTVTAFDNSGCWDQLDITVSQPNALNAYQGATTPASCGVNDGSAQVNVSGGTSPYTYLWVPTGGTGSLETNLSAGVYQVFVTDNNGCMDSTQIGVWNSGGPSVGLNSMQDVSCFGYSDGSIEIYASGGSAPYSYNWVPTGGNSAQATNLSGGTYSVVVTDASGCVGILTQDLYEPAEIIISSTVVKEDCGEGNGAVFATASGGEEGFTYSWSTGATTVFIDQLVHGTYSLTVTDWTGCSLTEIYEVTVEGNIPLEATIDPAEVFAGETVNLYADATGPAIPPLYEASEPIEYTWDSDYTLSCIVCQDPTANPMVDTFWVVTAVDDNGCTGIDTVWITIKEPCREIMVPTIFSPNDDGLNDNLCILGTCIEAMEFTIFNRWGQVVFHTQTQEDCWSGKINDKPAMSGIYAYRFHAVLYDGEVYDEEGKLTLVR